MSKKEALFSPKDGLTVSKAVRLAMTLGALTTLAEPILPNAEPLMINLARMGFSSGGIMWHLAAEYFQRKLEKSSTKQN